MTLSSYEQKCLDEIVSKFENNKIVSFSNEEIARYSSLLNNLVESRYIRQLHMDGGNAYLLEADLQGFVLQNKSNMKDDKRKQHSTTRKEVFIAIISAIVGGAITLFGYHFAEIINFVKGLF